MSETGKRGFTKIVVDEPGSGNGGPKRGGDLASRVEALAASREQDRHEIERLRAELDLVSAERDRLRRDLTSLETMQSDTRALEDGWDSERTQSGLPSIEELMQGASLTDETCNGTHPNLFAEIENEGSGEYEEMLSPSAMVLDSGDYPKMPVRMRFLALLDDDGRPQFPLDQDFLTIGRSESADIKIDDESISRIHARIQQIGTDSVIEDADSKNGTKINGASIKRHVLVHGDLIEAGTARLRFIDPSQISDDNE